MQSAMNRIFWLPSIFMIIGLLTACTARDSNSSREMNIEPDAVIFYTREGGIAGVSQEWVIHLDGTVDGPGDQELIVPPEEVKKLLEMVAQPEIISLAAEPSTPDACCDQFTYTITVVSGDQTWTMSTTDTAGRPQEVSELFASVEKLIDEAEPIR